ncbi:hypothetical protein ACTWP4_00820 [Gracilibacillus sp. D59]|uniref:hypothetical protein n=1 Tax=Gracilibacillus sp. D59 TaxID=3457434 RepID=UPI003FCC901C
MFENILFLTIVFIVMWLADFKRITHSSFRDRIIYMMMMIPVLYLSLIFVMDLKWPNLNELFHSIFSNPAKQIVEALKMVK